MYLMLGVSFFVMLGDLLFIMLSATVVVSKTPFDDAGGSAEGAHHRACRAVLPLLDDVWGVCASVDVIAICVSFSSKALVSFPSNYE
jgi:hypothetical protein